MASMRRRSEAEHRDCEMETRSAGSGMASSWSSSWEHARWKEDTAMQDRCLGWACGKYFIRH